MGLVAIALAGALLTPQELADQWAGAGFTPPPSMVSDSLALDPATLSARTAGQGMIAMSAQTMTASVRNVSFSGGADLQAGFHSGDINIGQDDASGMSGIQTLSLSTGFGSSVQAATSIAASGVVFGKN
jgi:hypothetical protein